MYAHLPGGGVLAGAEAAGVRGLLRSAAGWLAVSLPPPVLLMTRTTVTATMIATAAPMASRTGCFLACVPTRPESARPESVRPESARPESGRYAAWLRDAVVRLRDPGARPLCEPTGRPRLALGGGDSSRPEPEPDPLRSARSTGSLIAGIE